MFIVRNGVAILDATLYPFVLADGTTGEIMSLELSFVFAGDEVRIEIGERSGLFEQTVRGTADGAAR